MFHSADGRQKVGAYGLAALGLVVCGYVGSSYLKKPGEIRFGPASAASSGVRSDATKVAVHVAGAVRRPGLYELSVDQRVNDAIQAAGGLANGADANRLNLAQKLADGIQIYVPLRGEVVESPTVQMPIAPLVGSPSGEGSKQAASGAPAPGSISLNSASAAELDLLPGVGPATAAKIMEYRQAHGGFRSIDELMEVKGIGQKKLEKMRAYLRL